MKLASNFAGAALIPLKPPILILWMTARGGALHREILKEPDQVFEKGEGRDPVGAIEVKDPTVTLHQDGILADL